VLVRRLLLPALAVGALGVATTSCADQAAAANVGDKSLSDKDFRDELAETLDDETLLQVYGFSKETARGEAKGSYSQEYVTLLLNQQVSGLMAKEILASEGMEVTDADLADMESQLTDELAQSGADFSAIHKADRERLVELYAAIDKARSEVDSEVVQREADRLGRGVQINSRYGSWDADQGVIPPDGPLTEDDGNGALSSDDLQLPSG
jgi:hypothetical protein